TKLLIASILCIRSMFPQVPRARLLWDPEPIGPAPLPRGGPARRARVPRSAGGPRSRGPTGQGPAVRRARVPSLPKLLACLSLAFCVSEPRDPSPPNWVYPVGGPAGRTGRRTGPDSGRTGRRTGPYGRRAGPYNPVSGLSSSGPRGCVEMGDLRAGGPIPPIY